MEVYLHALTCLWRIVQSARGPEEVANHLVRLANLLLGDVGRGVDFTKRTWNVQLTTRQKEAAGNDRVGRLALDPFEVVDRLEVILGSIRRHLGHVERIGVDANLAIGTHEVPISLIGALLVRGSNQRTGCLVATHAIIIENRRLELRAREQVILGVASAAWVIIALIIIGKCPPLGARIDDAIAQDEATVPTDHITIRVLRCQIRRILFAVGTDQL